MHWDGWLMMRNRKQIAGNGGVAAVLAAMNTHSDNAKVASGCYTWDGHGSRCEILANYEDNDVPAVLAAMNTHSGIAKLQDRDMHWDGWL